MIAGIREELERTLATTAGSKRGWLVVVAVLIAAGLLVRLAVIDVPALDRTYWKEIDYLMISGDFSGNGYNILKPEIWWPAEEPRVTAMEFPLVPYLISVLSAVVGVTPLSARFLTLVSFLVMSWYVFLLARREVGLQAAVAAAFAATLLPLLFPPWNRLLYSDPVMLALSVAAVFHLTEWISGSRRLHGLAGCLAFSGAVALKITPLYLLLPIGWVAYRQYGTVILRYRKLATLLAIALIIPALWYGYASYLTLTSIDVFGIFDGHDKFQTWSMITDPGWLQTMYERITWRILGGKIGVVLFILGTGLLVWIRRGGLILWYLMAVICFMIIVAEGHLDAPYRQMTFVPPLSVLIGVGAVGLSRLGLELIRSAHSRFATVLDKPAIVVSFALVPLLFLGAWHHDRIFGDGAETPAHLSEWLLAKEIVPRAEEGDRLVWLGGYTIHKGGNDLSPVLYWYSGLQGWTLQEGEWTEDRVEDLISRGARFLAAREMSREPQGNAFLLRLKGHYRTIYENPSRELVLLDLRNRLSENGTAEAGNSDSGQEG